jgi:hypothetical protein
MKITDCKSASSLPVHSWELLVLSEENQVIKEKNAFHTDTQ